jgi:SSS family solute:Na+ symporter
MLAAMFSAEVSSADAVLFMLTTSVARDLVQTAFRRAISDANLLQTTRVTAVIAGAAGIALALWLQSILAALEIFYSLLAVSLFVPLLAGLYSSRPTAGAALAAMAAAVPATAAVHLLTHGAGLGFLTPAALCSNKSQHQNSPTISYETAKAFSAPRSLTQRVPC